MRISTPLVRHKRSTGHSRRRWLRRAAAVGVAAAALVASVDRPSGAALAPELTEVSVDSAAYRDARDDVDQTTRKLAAAKSARARATNRLTTLRNEDTALDADIVEATTRMQKAKAVIASVRETVAGIAIAGYTEGQGAESSSLLLDPNADADQAGMQAMFRRVTRDQVNALRAAQTEHDDAAAALKRAVTRQGEVRAAIAAKEQAQATAAQDEARLTKQLADQRRVLERARLLARVVGADFPLVALDAYWQAARSQNAAQPGCAMPWWALAGIGRIESGHGTSGNSRLLANGDTSIPITGIPLNGSYNTQAISDTDGGRVDGDATVDRAVGPMQFIPSTWKRWARDGNGNGTTNPHNLYDAARSAAAYLCASGPLDGDEGLRRAFFSYNHSHSYVSTVLTYGRSYSSLPVPKNR